MDQCEMVKLSEEEKSTKKYKNAPSIHQNCYLLIHQHCLGITKQQILGNHLEENP